MPRIGVRSATLCFDWGEAEGWQLYFYWVAVHIEFTIAVRERVVP